MTGTRATSQSRIAWPLWAFSLVLIVAAVVALGFLMDVNTIGATGRFTAAQDPP